MGKQEIVFQDAYGARLIVRLHMLDQKKFVLLVVPQPVEASAEELRLIAAKLENMATVGTTELWREKKRS